MGRIDLSGLNLNLLVAMDALLQTRGVSLAARRVHVTTSAMSHSLSALRELFADPLLVRVTTGMALTPLAESLVRPLSEALSGITRLFEGATPFEPSTAKRRFVIAAPDFLSTLLLGRLACSAQQKAPGIEFEVVPSARRGNSWMLETGELDLALGAVVDDAPGIRRMDLCTEHFACAVRRGHPHVRDRLTLDAYVETPHLMITLGDDDRPTWIDEELAKLGRTRHVALRIRYFMAAPMIVAETDLLVTGPAMLLRHFAELVPIEIFEPPIALPTYPEEAYWHERFDGEPAHVWLRERLRTIASELGTQTRPERRRWHSEPGASGRPRRNSSAKRT